MTPSNEEGQLCCSMQLWWRVWRSGLSITTSLTHSRYSSSCQTSLVRTAPVNLLCIFTGSSISKALCHVPCSTAEFSRRRILVGSDSLPGGVGHTSHVDGASNLVAVLDRTVCSQNKTIWALDMGALIAGAKYRGEFEVSEYQCCQLLCANS